VAAQVVTALSGFSGVSGSTVIGDCRQVSRTHIFVPTTNTHQQIVDFEIDVKEG
jgi:hypothetical protein